MSFQGSFKGILNIFFFSKDNEKQNIKKIKIAGCCFPYRYFYVLSGVNSGIVSQDRHRRGDGADLLLLCDDDNPNSGGYLLYFYIF